MGFFGGGGASVDLASPSAIGNTTPNTGAFTTLSFAPANNTTGSAFVNVGATATTVNGISLTAGQGYAWETTIPQGAVSLISTTTSSRYVAKQA